MTTLTQSVSYTAFELERKAWMAKPASRGLLATIRHPGLQVLIRVLSREAERARSSGKRALFLFLVVPFVMPPQDFATKDTCAQGESVAAKCIGPSVRSG